MILIEKVDNMDKKYIMESITEMETMIESKENVRNKNNCKRNEV